jgi:hypothetical protein
MSLQTLRSVRERQGWTAAEIHAGAHGDAAESRGGDRSVDDQHRKAVGHVLDVG